MVLQCKYEITLSLFQRGDTVVNCWNRVCIPYSESIEATVIDKNILIRLFSLQRQFGRSIRVLLVQLRPSLTDFEFSLLLVYIALILHDMAAQMTVLRHF